MARNRNRARRSARPGNRIQYSNRRGPVRTANSRSSALGGPATASASWIPASYRIIQPVTGDTFQNFKLSSSAAFVAFLRTAGEYRLRRIRCTWQPLVSDPRSGTLIAHPYFDDVNAGTSLADLYATGAKTRPVHSTFSTTIQYRQEPQISSVSVQGGVSWKWTTSASNASTATPGVWTLWIDLDQRGLKPVTGVAIAPQLPKLS
nr:hypothetical protein [Barnaviridae sp.]